MKVYTRRGDRGETDLFRGGRVPKDDPRVAAYGTTDELCSVLGLARAELHDAPRFHDAVLEVQRELFAAGGQLATEPSRWDSLEVGVSRVDAGMVDELERRIDAVEADHPLPREFVVPGGNRAAAALDVARTVCRRAERAVVELHREGLIPDTLLVEYLNRLSDYLYVLARAVEGEHISSRIREGS